MAGAGYRIQDEPTPGALAHFVVQPLWPLFAIMFCGAWFAWPWFAFNGFAVGSPTKWREALVAGSGFLGTALLIFLLGFLSQRDLVTGYGIEYAVISLMIWKLWVSYYLYTLQARSFFLYEYYGGVVRNGFIPLILTALFISPWLLSKLGRGFLLLVLR